MNVVRTELGKANLCINNQTYQMSQLEEQCEVSYWKEDAPVTREALMEGVKVISFFFFQDYILDGRLVVS